MMHRVLVGTIGRVRASLNVSVAEVGMVVGGLIIDNADEQDVNGRLEKNGSLVLQVSNDSTLVGRFDGQTFSGKVVWHDPLTIDTFSLAVPADSEQLVTDDPCAGQRCHFVGSLGAFAASLDLTITDDGFAMGQLNVDGRRLAVLNGILDADELTLEFMDRDRDGPAAAVPRLIGRFDGRTFAGGFFTYDARVWSKKMVIMFQFVASPHSSGFRSDVAAVSDDGVDPRR